MLLSVVPLAGCLLLLPLQVPLGVFAAVPNLASLSLAGNNIERLERGILIGLRVGGASL